MQKEGHGHDMIHDTFAQYGRLPAGTASATGSMGTMYDHHHICAHIYGYSQREVGLGFLESAE